MSWLICRRSVFVFLGKGPGLDQGRFKTLLQEVLLPFIFPYKNIHFRPERLPFFIRLAVENLQVICIVERFQGLCNAEFTGPFLPESIADLLFAPALDPQLPGCEPECKPLFIQVFFLDQSGHEFFHFLFKQTAGIQFFPYLLMTPFLVAAEMF